MSFKVRDDHWEAMLSFFEENKELAVGRFQGPNGREKNKKLWAELAMRLNALGFCERSVDKWQKTWTDFKYSLKKKGRSLKCDQTGTGGGPGKTAPFNKFELRALNILGKSFFEGVGSIEVAVVASTEHEMEHIEKERVPFRTNATPSTKRVAELESDGNKNEPSTSQDDHNYTYTPSIKKKRTDGIEEAYKETITVLKDIKNVVDSRLGQIVDRLDELIRM